MDPSIVSTCNKEAWKLSDLASVSGKIMDVLPETYEVCVINDAYKKGTYDTAGYSLKPAT